MQELNDLIFTVAPDAAVRQWKASFRHPFTLENGGEQLAPCFTEIEMRPYDDGLDVTEVEPLVAYILSIDAPGFREPAIQAAFTGHAQELMADGAGTIHLSKSVGLFVARRRD